jgi:starch synthase
MPNGIWLSDGVTTASDPAQVSPLLGPATNPHQQRAEGSIALKVLFVSAECYPFATTGGLGNVVGSLPRYLRRRGIDVRVVLPLYAGMPWNDFEILDDLLVVPMWYGNGFARARAWQLSQSDVPVYFLEYNRYFDRPHLYGPPDGGYSDNLERFAFLSRGSLELCKALDFIPDVVHAHDWHTALVPVYLNTVEWLKPLHGSASVFTIHNLGYQGVVDPGAMFITGLGREHYHPGEFEHFNTMNVMKAGIAHATALTTVSPTYAHEIQTPALGSGLDGELSRRSGRLFGILNGIDVADWDPADDPRIAASYSADHLGGKARCKDELQRRAGLARRADVPVFSFIGRLVHQKGVDVLAQALWRALEWDMQMVVLGTGTPDAEGYLSHVAWSRRDKMVAWIQYDHARAHELLAGADFLLMPSRYEPCGLSQLYGLRYGTLPIVHGTGGLIDTVYNYDEATGDGTGFVFYGLQADTLANTIGWALWTWYNRPRQILTMRKRAMEQDFSWNRSAAAYDGIYRLAYLWRRGHPLPEEQAMRRVAGPPPPSRLQAKQPTLPPMHPDLHP